MSQNEANSYDFTKLFPDSQLEAKVLSIKVFRKARKIELTIAPNTLIHKSDIDKI